MSGNLWTSLWAQIRKAARKTHWGTTDEGAMRKIHTPAENSTSLYLTLSTFRISERQQR